MSAPDTVEPENPYARTYADFLAQTREHVLVVLHDEDLYRHFRIQAPGTRMWSWDVTTWPGHLATSGDIADGYMFNREPDMIGFFASAGKSEGYYSDGAPSIDFRYWAEKLCGGRSREVRQYDPDLFIQLVREHLEESEGLGTEAQEVHHQQLALLARLHELRGLDGDAQLALFEAHWTAQEHLAATGTVLNHERRNAAAAARAALWSTDGIPDEKFDRLTEEHNWMELADIEVPRHSPAERRMEIIEDARWHADSESEAHKWLAEHEDTVGSDTWEWDLRDWDIHFLFTCYCVDLAVRLYREHAAAKTQQSAA
jgi:hypothetical protein